MTSNAKLIYDKLVELHPQGIKPITELSYNVDGKKNFIVSNEEGFDYDLVYNCSPCYDREHKEKSPDALFCVGEKLYFVEFKDGAHDKTDIRLKIHEGVTTLYMFVAKHLPSITKSEFIKLDINYAVIVRGDTRSHGSSFQSTLFDTSKKYNIKNIEGWLVRKAGLTSDPSIIVRLLNTVTDSKLTAIEIADYLGAGAHKTFSL